MFSVSPLLVETEECGSDFGPMDGINEQFSSPFFDIRDKVNLEAIPQFYDNYDGGFRERPLDRVLMNYGLDVL